MNKSIACVFCAILVLFSFNLGQADHPEIHDATEGNVLLVTTESANDVVPQVDDTMDQYLA